PRGARPRPARRLRNRAGERQARRLDRRAGAARQGARSVPGAATGRRARLRRLRRPEPAPLPALEDAGGRSARLERDPPLGGRPGRRLRTLEGPRGSPEMTDPAAAPIELLTILVA